ncbi:hypothetical protein SH611_12055 [Geminicoccaceae bacterium 1502E]|nr:hypothetical protein [Geminicoccaceae bacterium 1502E]
MFHHLLDLQRASLRPMARFARELGGLVPWSPAGAFGDWLTRALDAGEPASEPIEEALARHWRCEVRATLEHEDAFVRIVRLARPGGPGKGTTLLAGPFSGYAASVLGQLVGTLLELGEVLVTDWQDARLVPVGAGPYDLACQTRDMGVAMELAGGNAGLVALSQAGWAALAALAAAPAASRPGAVALLGCPIATQSSPVALQELVAGMPAELIAEQVLRVVPDSLPGAGRLVFPSVLQLAAVAGADPLAYAEIQSGLLLELMGLVDGGYESQHRHMHALIDVPGELYLDLAARLRGEKLADAAVPAGTWPRRLPLLTVEAARDSLVGQGQTHGAQRLFGHADRSARSLTIEGAEHHDLFLGQLYAARLAPALARFLAGAQSE